MKNGATAIEFRVGRKAKRTIYVQLGDLASNDDTLIGLVDTPQIAAFLVEAANEKLRQLEQGDGIVYAEFF